MQIPTKPGAQTYATPITMTPSLETALKTHRIWLYPQVWLYLSLELEVNTLTGIHFLQDQMAAYEADPNLLENVSLSLIK